MTLSRVATDDLIVPGRKGWIWFKPQKFYEERVRHIASVRFVHERGDDVPPRNIWVMDEVTGKQYLCWAGADPWLALGGPRHWVGPYSKVRLWGRTQRARYPGWEFIPWTDLDATLAAQRIQQGARGG